MLLPARTLIDWRKRSVGMRMQMQDAAVRAIRGPPGAAGWGQGTTVASLAVPDRPTSDAASWIVCFGKRRYTRWSGIRVVMRKESTAKSRGSRDDEVSSRGKETLLFESFALFPLLDSFRSGNLLGPSLRFLPSSFKFFDLAVDE